MFTELLRDQAFAIMWLGLMSAAWFGWGQEDPRPSLRGWLGAGSVLGILTSAAFGVLVWRNWDAATMLAGRFWIFGLVVLAEVVLIGGGCVWLARRELTRWFGWWIGLCVALHFVPLAWVFDDWSYVVLAALQVVGLLLMLRVLAKREYPTSRWACPWIGVTFLLYALGSAVGFVSHFGYPV